MRGCETDVFTDSGVLDDMLRCPCELHHEVSVDRATATITCTYARCHLVGRTFPIIDGQPVLVDFRNSVLDEATTIDRGAPTLIGRSSGWRHTLARMVFGDKPMARRNAARFLHELKSRVRRPVVLVVGGGAMGDGAEALYQDPDIRLIAFDIYRSDLTHFIADAHSIPLAEETIDGVWIQAVLEHVLSPERVVAEIFRVLRPGGLVYAETPFMQQVHEGAYDFTRFTESGHRWLFRRFALIDSGLERGPFSVLLWSIRYALTGLTRSRLLATLICTLLFWLRYFDHLVPVLSPADVVRAYGGARHRGDHTPRGVSTVKSPRLSTAPLGLDPLICPRSYPDVWCTAHPVLVLHPSNAPFCNC